MYRATAMYYYCCCCCCYFPPTTGYCSELMIMLGLFNWLGVGEGVRCEENKVLFLSWYIVLERG